MSTESIDQLCHREMCSLMHYLAKKIKKLAEIVQQHQDGNG